MSGDVKKLKAFLKTLHAEQVRTNGKFAYWLVPGQGEVPVPLKASTEFTSHHWAIVAKALGFTVPDLREAMDSEPPSRGGRGQGEAVRSDEPTITRAEMDEALSNLSAAKGELERQLKKPRDDAFRRHAISNIIAATAELRRPMRGQGDDPGPPPARLDDSKFRPASTDKLLTGPGRVTGITAKAVRREHALTKWQIEEGQK